MPANKKLMIIATISDVMLAGNKISAKEVALAVGCSESWVYQVAEAAGISEGLTPEGSPSEWADFEDGEVVDISAIKPSAKHTIELDDITANVIRFREEVGFGEWFDTLQTLTLNMYEDEETEENEYIIKWQIADSLPQVTVFSYEFDGGGETITDFSQLCDLIFSVTMMAEYACETAWLAAYNQSEGWAQQVRDADHRLWLANTFVDQTSKFFLQNFEGSRLEELQEERETAQQRLSEFAYVMEEANLGHLPESPAPMMEQTYEDAFHRRVNQ